MLPRSVDLRTRARRTVSPLASSARSSSQWRSKWSSRASLLRPVTMRTSRSPARVASSTTYWMAGLSTTDSISLGVALVAGRKRVPIPAAGITALVTVPRVGADEAGCSVEVMSPTLVGEPARKCRTTLRTVDNPVADRPDNPPSRTSRWLPGLAISTAVAAYVLIVFGSHVRVSDSGMGCPGWPLCSGSVGPIYEFHALMEQTHRYIAAIVTILAFLTALLAFRARAQRATTVRPAVFTAGVIVVQIALGAVTVFAGNGAPTVAAHLIAGRGERSRRLCGWPGWLPL